MVLLKPPGFSKRDWEVDFLGKYRAEMYG